VPLSSDQSEETIDRQNEVGLSMAASLATPSTSEAHEVTLTLGSGKHVAVDLAPVRDALVESRHAAVDAVLVNSDRLRRQAGDRNSARRVGAPLSDFEIWSLAIAERVNELSAEWDFLASARRRR
jgi:hypothetical protein